MSKELEALKCLETITNRIKFYYDMYKFDNTCAEEIKTIKQALQHLEKIENANPSEALKCLERIHNEFSYRTSQAGYECLSDDDLIDIITIKKVLIKAEKDKALEKELGCPLEVVFKALANGIYCEDVVNHIQYMPVDLHLNLDGKYLLYFADEEWVLTKNYKKTWWLREDKSE